MVLRLFIVPADTIFIDIAATDLSNIASRLTTRGYITQEVIFGDGEPILPSEYVSIGKYQAPWPVIGYLLENVYIGDVQECVFIGCPTFHLD